MKKTLILLAILIILISAPAHSGRICLDKEIGKFIACEEKAINLVKKSDVLCHSSSYTKRDQYMREAEALFAEEENNNLVSCTTETEVLDWTIKRTKYLKVYGWSATSIDDNNYRVFFLFNVYKNESDDGRKYFVFKVNLYSEEVNRFKDDNVTMGMVFNRERNLFEYKYK